MVSKATSGVFRATKLVNFLLGYIDMVTYASHLLLDIMLDLTDKGI